MGQKQVKKYARVVRRNVGRNKKKIIKEFVKAVKHYKLLDRLKFAWAIIKASE